MSAALGAALIVASRRKVDREFFSDAFWYVNHWADRLNSWARITCMVAYAVSIGLITWLMLNNVLYVMRFQACPRG